MPIYEYRCTECSFQEEYLQKVSEPQKTVCPSCGKETFRKLLSAAGFQLKGSGWYVTDFRNKGGKSAEGKSGKVASDAGASDKNEAKSSDSQPSDAKGSDTK